MSAGQKQTFTTTETAAAVGISRATVQAWISAGKFEPPPLQSRPGEPPARVWCRADVERLRALKATIYRRGAGRGRKKKLRAARKQGRNRS